MYLSVLFLPRVVEGLTLLGALCVIRMCREELGLPVELRWPNDVYHEGRKLCGVLPQVKYHGQEIERVVLGVGLNVNQPPDTFPQTLPATTLSQCYPGHAFEVRDVASRYLEVLAEEMEPYQRDGCHALAKRCERYLEGKGREVGLSSSDGTLRNLGRVSGLSPSGELLLDSGERLSQLSTEGRLVFF